MNTAGTLQLGVKFLDKMGLQECKILNWCKEELRRLQSIGQHKQNQRKTEAHGVPRAAGGGQYCVSMNSKVVMMEQFAGSRNGKLGRQF